MTLPARVNELGQLKRVLQDDKTLTCNLERAFDLIGFTEDAAIAPRTPGKRKAIKDNVWGMLDLSAHEMHLIDSPLLQRMRGIHQLGFTYLTYPSAEHTRFIHSLGMAHVVSNFIAGIDRDRKDDPTPATSKAVFQRFDALKPLNARELLYAALLHDVGHMPFSHASEAPLSSNSKRFTLGGDTIEKRLAQVQHAVGKAISLSEAMSILIVLSERFEAFYGVLDPTLATDKRSLPRIACLIAGVPTIESSPNIQEIISAAAVDADKIDYVNRDARACGISVGVDVSRIFLGGGVIRARRSQYDDTYDGDDMTTLFVVNSSGADTLDEIVQARSSLYQRVYLHPLTRTAEALLARALLANADRGDQADSKMIDAFGIWAMSDDELLKRISSSDDAEVAALGTSLRLRRMPKKCCAFAGSLAVLQSPLNQQFRGLSVEIENTIRKDVGNSFLEQLTRDNIGKIGTTELEDEIRKESQLLADLLRKSGSQALVPATELKTVVVTSIATTDNSRPDAMVFQNGEIVRTPALTNVQGQHDAYDIFKAVGYVLCDPEWRQIAFHAARTVLHRRSLAPDLVARSLTSSAPPVSFRQHTLLDFDGSARRSNLRLDDVHDVHHAAQEAGYFDDKPILARRMSDGDESIRSVAAKYGMFDGEGGWRVRPATVAAFADQFPPKFRSALLQVLKDGTFLGQTELSALLSQQISQLSTGHFAQASLTPLSASSGGGTLAMLKEALGSGKTLAADIREALRNKHPIILVDDNSASGVQSSAQLYAFSGRPLAEWPSDLQSEKSLFGALSSVEWEEIKARPLAVVTAVGAETARQRLLKTAASLGLTEFHGLHYAKAIGASTFTLNGDLQEFLSDVGRDLLAWRWHNKPYRELGEEEKAQCDEHCFGYGNHGGVTVTNVNVPSSTVTAFWQPGQYMGRPWIPLFLRRTRYQDLILA